MVHQLTKNLIKNEVMSPLLSFEGCTSCSACLSQLITNDLTLLLRVNLNRLSKEAVVRV